MIKIIINLFCKKLKIENDPESGRNLISSPRKSVNQDENSGLKEQEDNTNIKVFPCEVINKLNVERLFHSLFFSKI